MLLVAGLLTAGALGVLWFNTALQRQAVERTAQQQVITRLQLQAQALDVSLHHLEDPAVLAASARRLRMRPARTFRWADRDRSA